jgi:deoxyribonuclease IV
MSPARKKAAKKAVKTAAKKAAKTALKTAPKTVPKRPAGSIKPTGRPSAEPRPDLSSLPFALGAHVSSAGGSAETPPRAHALGATALQLFTKTANQWREREISAEEAAAFQAARTAAGVRFAVSHDSYLINLASPDATLRARSIESFRAELRRSNALGLDGIVSHPGNFMDDHDAGLARNAEAIAEALAAEPGTVRLFLETTAGSGTALGRTFEELAAIIGMLPQAVAARVAVCLDTCHVFAAGYDLVEDYDGVWARFDDTLGLNRLAVMHLNDSQGALGSRKDRHAGIGEGHLGAATFRRIMRDPRLAHVPKIVETPKGDDPETFDRRNLGRLLAMAADTEP